MTSGLSYPSYLNLGSFVDVCRRADWTNIDILPIEIDGVYCQQADLRHGLPMYQDGTIKGIRASHVLEHLTLEDAARLVRECARVLVPGGVLRVSVPDGNLLVSHFLSGTMSRFDSIQPPEYVQARTQGEKLSRILFSGDYQHQAIYTRDMLAGMIEAAGLRAAPMLPGFSHDVRLVRDIADQHVEVSMFMEGVKA